MPYIILFKDNPDADPGIRQTHMPAHLDFLEENRDVVTAAGPLKDGAGKGAGGIWIVNAASPEAADALVHEDPFWPTGLRASYEILEWTQVFANGKRLL